MSRRLGDGVSKKIELRSVDGFTALSIAGDLARRDAKYRAGWLAGYLVGRGSALDEVRLSRFDRASLARHPKSVKRRRTSG